MRELIDPMRPLRSKPPVKKASTIEPVQPVEPPEQKAKPRRRTRMLPKRYIVASLLLIALLVTPESIGQILVLAYAVLTILRRFSMLLTFALAALLLLISPIFTWLTGSEENGSILAGYSFILLGLGLVQLIIAYRHLKSPSRLRR